MPGGAVAFCGKALFVVRTQGAGLDQQTVRALAHEAFGAWTMVRADAAWAEAAVPHEPMRRFLVEVGVPVEMMLFAVEERFLRPAVTVAQLATEEPDWWDAETVSGHEDAIALGEEPNGGWFVVDPRTGQVDLIGDGGAESQSSSLAIFVYCLAYFEKHRRLDGVTLDRVEPFDTAAEAGYELLRHFSQVDPAAFEGIDAPSWADGGRGELDTGHAWEWMADGFADGLYADWGWSDTSLRYFAQQGIDPAEREPLRPNED